MSGIGFSVRNRIVFALVLLSLGVTAVAGAQEGSKRGRKYKPPQPTSHVEITVTRATNGKPVENASVIFHPLVNGKNDGNMELKTNDDGKTTIDLLEVGSHVRLQIIKPGFQTYGEDYTIDKETMSIDIKLNRPAEQYSTYKHAADAAKSGDKPDAGKDPKSAEPSDKPKDDAPEAQKDADKQDAPKQDPPKQDPPK